MSHPSTSLTSAMRAAFWQVVEDCLVEFHAMLRERAVFDAAELRRDVETAPSDIDGDLVYHSEPFYTACDLAGLVDLGEQDRLLDGNRAKYESILTIHGW